MVTPGSQPPHPGTPQRDVVIAHVAPAENVSPSETEEPTVKPDTTAPETVRASRDPSSNTDPPCGDTPSAADSPVKNNKLPLTTPSDVDRPASTPSSSDDETEDEALENEDEYNPPHVSPIPSADSNPRVTRSAARAGRSRPLPPRALPPQTALPHPTPTQDDASTPFRRTKRPLAAFQQGNKSPSPIRKKWSTPAAVPRNQSLEQTYSQPTSSTARKTTPGSTTRKSQGRVANKPPCRPNVSPRTPHKQTSVPPIQEAGHNASSYPHPEVSGRAKKNPQTTARKVFEEVRAVLACPQDNCNAIGSWRVKGADDIQCTICMLRVTKQRFVALLEQHASTESEERNTSSHAPSQANQSLTSPDVAELQKMVKDQAAQIRQLLEVQTCQQSLINELQTSIQTQNEQLEKLRCEIGETNEAPNKRLPRGASPPAEPSLLQSSLNGMVSSPSAPPPRGETMQQNDSPQQMEEREAGQSRNSPRHTSQSDGKDVAPPCLGKALSSDQNNVNTTSDCTREQRQQTPEATQRTNDPVNHAAMPKPSPNSANTTSSAPAKPNRRSYKDAATSKDHGKRGARKSVPWASLPPNAKLSELPPDQQDAIKRAQKALARLSRRTPKATASETEPTAIYFGNVKRAPFRVVYKALQRITARKHLLGISFIGSDILEVLLQKQAVEATIRKMRYLQWKHLPNFNPEIHDTSEYAQDNLEPGKRIIAVYMRWYSSWVFSRSRTAREWYATQGSNLYKAHSNVFMDAPEKQTFELLREAKARTEAEATAELRRASHGDTISGDDWTLVTTSRNLDKQNRSTTPANE